MPRTPRLTRASRARILAFAGTAAALAGAGTAAAANASAATTPHTTAVTAAAVTPATALPAGLASGPYALTGTGPAPALTGTTPHARVPAPVATPAEAPAAPAGPAAGHATHGTAVTTTTRTAHLNHGTRPDHPAASHAWHGDYQMYDSVTPSSIPGGKAVATYADGPYAATPAAMTGKNVTWIDTNGSDPHGATVLDVEPGDATPAGAATWAAQRLDYHPHSLAVIYTMRSEWAAAQTAVSALPHWQQNHVRWWIADPTGTPHIVPGSSATQWYWGTNYDISTVTPGF
jgi:hypothetical protein